MSAPLSTPLPSSPGVIPRVNRGMLVPCDRAISTYKTSLRNSVSRKIMKLCDWTGVNRWQTQIYFSSLEPYFAGARRNRFSPNFLHLSFSIRNVPNFLLSRNIYRKYLSNHGTNQFRSFYLSKIWIDKLWIIVGITFREFNSWFERILINVEEISLSFSWGRKEGSFIAIPWKLFYFATIKLDLIFAREATFFIFRGDITI